jgi:hypothetical protein
MTSEPAPAGKRPSGSIMWGAQTPPEYLTYREFIKRLAPLVCGPVDTLIELKGDMYLSDFRDLEQASSKLEDALYDIEGHECMELAFHTEESR